MVMAVRFLTIMRQKSLKKPLWIILLKRFFGFIVII